MNPIKAIRMMNGDLQISEITKIPGNNNQWNFYHRFLEENGLPRCLISTIHTDEMKEIVNHWNALGLACIIIRGNNND